MTPRPCPFCGKTDRVHQFGRAEVVTECSRCEVIVSTEIWQRRPIEDELTRTLDEAASQGAFWPV